MVTFVVLHRGSDIEAIIKQQEEPAVEDEGRYYLFLLKVLSTVIVCITYFVVAGNSSY